jgi:hypothetical protein
VKLDVQGWESRVLAGATRLLAHSHIVWSLEVSPKHLEFAGTPVSRLVDQIARHFTHVIDLRRKIEPVDTRRPGALADFMAHVGQDGAESYANLLLYTAGTR